MPVWHELTRQARQSGDLVVLGVIQEQHPDRGRLFAQWKEFDWPLLHDPMNRLELRVVPVLVAIDETGVVVDSNLTADELANFLARPATATSDVPAHKTPTAESGPSDKVDEVNNSLVLMQQGDQEILWLNGEPEVRRADKIDLAIKTYRKAVAVAQTDDSVDLGAAKFRLGVALRMRYDSPSAQRGDFQAAVDAWGDALDADPNHYIYRRRIQQYGPRQIKPYPFYDWIAAAREEIAARGETPVNLVTEPVGAEIARPTAGSARAEHQGGAKQPDPEGRIVRDTENLIDAAVTVVPGQIKRGDVVQVHLTLRPSRLSHWNNEAEPTMIWIDLPRGWQADQVLLESEQPDAPESREPRRFDFELRSPGDATRKAIDAYALYYICEQKGGTCLYLRKDIEIPIQYRP